MKSNSAKKSARSGSKAPQPAPTPIGKALMWLVVVTCVVVLFLLMQLARDLLGQLELLGGQGGAASTRLLTGLFVVMCLGGFTAAATWAALKKVLGRDKK